MRRLLAPAPFLFVLNVASSAHAQAAPAAAPAPAAAATPAVSAAVPAAPATLAPATAAEAEEAKADKFPLGINASLSNSVGNGLLQTGGIYQMRPSWGTSVSINPSAQLPTFDVLPKMSVGGSVGFSIANWIPSFDGSGVYDRIVRVSDFSLSLRAPGIYKEEFTNISVSPSLGVSLPLSLGSRQINRLLGTSAGVGVNWGSPETPVGEFSVGYSIRGGFNIFTQNAASVPCDATIVVANTATNPVDRPFDNAPLYFGREAEVLPNGECRLAGRQSLGSIANNISAGWQINKSHSLSISLGMSHSFLRPLSNEPELHSPYSTDQGFNESSNADIGYSYNLPFEEFQSSISAGVGSGQPMWTADGSAPRFPFWDFRSPGNNFSAAYLNLSVGI